MTVRILATGDIHIGRRPTKVDAADASRWSCARMWETIVERAVIEKVDVVALSGDVVDHDNRFFEATGPLERGIRRLADKDIDTVAVSGNHDYDVLHRLADSIGSKHFHLLGRGGRWEEKTLQRNGQPVLRVQGWSFPAVHVTTSPLAAYDLSVGADLPTLGILHADLGAKVSRYAPVTIDELRSTDIHFWLLGHIHRPKLDESAGGSAVLYPGSPQAMDPGEVGPHGPWILEIDGPRAIRARQLPLSRVRYESLLVDLAGAADQTQFEAHIIQRVRTGLEDVVAERAEAELLSLRLTLTGRTTLCGEIDQLARNLTDELSCSSDGVTAQVESPITNNTQPDIDLSEWALRSDLPGQIAQLMLKLQLQQADEQVDSLLHSTRQSMCNCYDATAYHPIGDTQRPEIEDARAILLRQGMKILDALRRQKVST